MNKTANLFLRYAIIIILGIKNFYLLQKILTPLTIYSSNIAIKIFTKTTLSGDLISFNNNVIQIATPCVATSAFYLLIFLLLAIPTTKAKAIFSSLATFFILNIIRITALASIITSPNFEIIHWIIWHLISTVLVVGIYIATIKFYKIKEIPIISDFKYLKSMTKKNSKHS